MTFLWDITLYQMARGYRCVIKGGGRTVTGQGETPYGAYHSAEIQLVIKPAFFLNPDEEYRQHLADVNDALEDKARG